MIKKFLLCFFSIHSLSFAEVALSGLVVDYESGVPLRDANVRVVGTKLGDATDISGSFIIDILDPGSYEIVVSVIGFEEASQTVSIREGQSKKIRFELRSKILELDPVLILKERSSVVGFGPKFLRIPGSTSVVTSRDLAKYNDTDINRIITRIPGVYVQEEDGFGLRPNIGMRGTGVERSSKINLMEDGIPIAPAPYSSPAAYYSPTAGRMESFEVRKGSSQIKYGPQSTGGALNYISTSIPRDFRVKANLFGGQFNTYKAHVNIGSSGETFGYLLETFIDQTTGFKNLDHAGQNTGYSKADYLSKFRFNTPKSFTIPAAIELKYGITDELSNETYLGLSRSDFSIDPLRRYAASGIDEMDADHAQTVLTGVVKPLANVDLTFAYYKNEFNRNWYKLSKVGGVSIGSILSSDNNHPAYALLSAEDTSDDVFQIKANNRMYKSTGFQLVANSRFSLLNSYHNLMVGYRDHSDEMDRFQKVDKYAMRSKELVLTTIGIWGTGSKNNRFYYADAISYFIEDEVEAGPFKITVGVRAEDISVQRKEWKGDVSDEGGSWNDPNRELTPSVKTKKLDVIVPGIGMVYKLNPSLSLISGIHKGFSPPGPGVDEEDDVKPEESVNLELGFRYRVGLTEIVSTIFNNLYQNLLGDDTQYAGSGSYDQFNAGQVNINGLELAASHIIPIGLKFMPLHLSYTFTSTEFLNSFESNFEAWGTVMAGDEMPYVPKHQLFSEAGLEDRAWSSYIRFRLIDAMRTVAGSGGIDSDFSTDVVVLFDFSAEISISSTSRLFFNMNNIFNNHYVAAARPAGVRPTMPRNIVAGVKIIL
ncbi:MAG: TonB-dependent receptor [Candidatus Marinimicrobia bacterium]|jgi:Fe(3+) dicitrate transport protein|nr:TonB-dependent receptor [Candidatus Neomarinimicrobiota bacterium]MDP7061131.1 TonB-dependent receptor [Candidatus Neomarinimicrobiota bacterium]|tara:strand:+ start:415 stop:2877 length:2463 start_codon:yes stop_codon:yes gene_type:complete